jgi:hypothetical protein
MWDGDLFYGIEVALERMNICERRWMPKKNVGYMSGDVTEQGDHMEEGNQDHACLTLCCFKNSRV